MSKHLGLSMSAPRISTYLYIAGSDLNPSACTTALGIEPTEIWRQKQEVLKHRADIPSISWNLGQQGKELCSISEAVEEVLDMAWPARDRIREFVRDKHLQVGIACTVVIREDRPIYDLTPIAVGRLAELSCGFMLDIVDYSA